MVTGFDALKTELVGPRVSWLDTRQAKKSGLKSVTLISDPNPVSQVLW